MLKPSLAIACVPVLSVLAACDSDRDPLPGSERGRCLDKSYVASGAAPASCTCSPEHYTVALQTATGGYLPLKPVLLDANNTTCSLLTASSTEGCGSTAFVVP